MPNLLAEDLDRILRAHRATWESLRGAQILVTGGSGFMGKWMLESVLWANDELDLRAEVTVLSRSQRLQVECPHLKVNTVYGDLNELHGSEERFSHVAHLATFSDGPISSGSADQAELTIVEGTRNILKFAPRAKVMFTSSGAVYGESIGRAFKETDETLPTTVYGQAKLAAEQLVLARGVVARCFAFIGPYLPLGAQFAAGNFIADVLDGRAVNVSGDGSAVRSYLYAADMAGWLWTLLAQAREGSIYNVGGSTPISIRELAKEIGHYGVGFHLQTEPAYPATPQIYVPDTSKAATEFGFDHTTSLSASILRTIRFHRTKALLKPEMEETVGTHQYR